jgi:hypothetical protein
MADLENTVVTAGFTVDRSPSTGNSPGIDARYALHVKVKNKITEPIYVQTTPAPALDPHYVDIQDTTTPGSEQTLFSVTVPVGKIRAVKQLDVICRMDVKWYIDDGTTIFASGRTSAGHNHDTFTWDTTPRAFAAGTTLTLKATARPGMPGADIEAYFQAADM